jgi:acyl carrier protein
MGNIMKLIKADDVEQILVKAFKHEIDVNPDTPLLESGLRLESLAMLRALVEFEKLLDMEIEQEDAFELFSLSINELVDHLNTMCAEVHSS